MMSSLKQLEEITMVVADTANLEDVAKFKPVDATTNPSLILSAINSNKYENLMDKAVDYGMKNASELDEQVELAADYLTVLFGCKILEMISGRVSTEIDAKLSFDREGCIAKALRIIDMYEHEGFSKERVLVKLAATWEGIEAAKVLEQKHNVHCNLTLVFSLPQAIACAEANVTLISPFVGRILDWHKKHGINFKIESPSDDPGVKSVKAIYDYYKKFGYKTLVMGASFRNIDQIKELVGCDLLTISPQFLKELDESTEQLVLKLDRIKCLDMDLTKLCMDEKKFRWMLNQDKMASEKLSEGIRNFANDSEKMKQIISDRIKLLKSNLL